MSFNSALIETTIEIDAPPEKVREVALDFENRPKWNNRMLHKTIVQRDSATIHGIDAQPGDSVTVTNVSGVGYATLQTNSPTAFVYSGSKFGITAVHGFEYTALNEGKRTLFRQFDTVTGGPSFLFMRHSPLRLWLKPLFQSVNSDLKRIVEKGL